MILQSNRLTKCAITACESLNAVCQHKQTRRRYCPACARAINDRNPGLVEFPTQILLLPRELAAVLAGLRAIQLQMNKPLDGKLQPGILQSVMDEVLTDGDTLEPLDSPEIDALCERINEADE